VEISNPGGLPSGLDAKEFGTKSVVRNPVIASLLNRADYIEQIGTGINRIKNSVKEHGQGNVEFYYNNFFIVTFTRTKKVPKKLGIKLGDKLGVKLGENEIKILELMRDNKYITTKELSEHIKISTTAVDNNISKLKKKGILERIGPAKGGHWKIK
jgi:ATP-dependent DNA helicase RecG